MNFYLILNILILFLAYAVCSETVDTNISKDDSKEVEKDQASTSIISPLLFFYFNLNAQVDADLEYENGLRFHCEVLDVIEPNEFVDTSIDITTAPFTEYQYLIAPTDGCFNIKIKADSQASIALSEDFSLTTPTYEILLGGWHNSYSAVYLNGQLQMSIATPEILNGTEYREFNIIWTNTGMILVQIPETQSLVVFYKNLNPMEIAIRAVGVKTKDDVSGEWKIKNPEKQCPQAPITTPTLKSYCWIWI